MKYFVIPTAVLIAVLLFSWIKHERDTMSLYKAEWTCEKTAPYRQSLSAKQKRRQGREYLIVQRCVLYRKVGH